LKVPLKIEENIEASIKYVNDTIRWAGWKATPQHTGIPIAPNYPILIRQKRTEK
jgi:hypothetical protein